MVQGKRRIGLDPGVDLAIESVERAIGRPGSAP